MKTSTEIGSIAALVGYERSVELVAKAGFDAWDFSLMDMARPNKARDGVLHTDHPLHGDNYAAFAESLRKIGEAHGIHCNQTHAPHPIYIDEIKAYMKRAIECTAIVGAGICVIHPDNYKSAAENAEMYRELLPFAKAHGVKIATENMWCWDKEKGIATPAACSHHDDFLAHLSAVNDPDFVACLDLGHAEMRDLGTSAEQMILTLGGHVQALHIHDNDLKRDRHQIPFSMDMDFERIVKALKKIGYNGYLTLEANKYMSAYTADDAPLGVKNLYRSVKRLADMFETV